MKRIMVVDDERHIVDWLYELLELENDSDWEIYKAYSATEAIDHLSKVKIDVAVCDIQMPGMNGLALLEKIHADWPHCRAIMLTGHKQFDYIYAAGKYHGTLYLMKTEDDDVILETVRAQIKAVEEEALQKKLFTDSQRKSRLLAQNLSLGEWARSGGVPPLSQDIIDRHGIGLSSQRSVRLLAAYGKQMRAGSHENLCLLICRHLEHMYEIAQWSHNSRMVLCLLQKRDTCGVQNSVEISRITQVLDDVLSLLDQEGCGSPSFLLDDTERPLSQIPSRIHPIKQMLEQLQDNGPFVTTVSALPQDAGTRGSHKLVHSIKRYINSNLDGDLSLTAISGKVSYNTSYISRVFKQEENVKLSDYILLTRINAAKGILSTSGHTINDIARMVGFDTPQYFSTVFRRLVGVSPAQFRSNSRNSSTE